MRLVDPFRYICSQYLRLAFFLLAFLNYPKLRKSEHTLISGSPLTTFFFLKVLRLKLNESRRAN